jgi:hypothetical protein
MAITSDRSKWFTPQQPPRKRMPAGGFFLWALVTGAVGAAVVVGYLTMSSPESSEAVISATGPRDPSESSAEIDDGIWTDADIDRCKAEATAAREAAAERKLAAVSADRVGLGGPDAAMVERATYLLCSASRKPLHLCEGYWKKWFIETITAYATEFRQVSAQTYWTRFNLAERARHEGAANQEEWRIITDDLDQTTREVVKIHADILATFHALIADGIIEPEDFGKFFGLGIPPDVGRMIGDVRPLRELCG